MLREVATLKGKLHEAVSEAQANEQKGQIAVLEQVASLQIPIARPSWRLSLLPLLTFSVGDWSWKVPPSLEARSGWDWL